MFTALESELVRILRANLSPRHVPADRVVTGPIEVPPSSGLPTVAVTAGSFKLVPDEAVSPPRGARVPTEDAFGPNGGGPFALSRPPLQPLRAVEVEAGGGGRVLLRERDDYTVDYVNGRVRLREAPDGPVRVQYFALEPLRVVYSSRLRVECRLEVFGSTAAGGQHGDTIAAVALGAVAANAGTLDGLRSERQDVLDSGLPSLGARQVFFVFEAPTALGGTQIGPATWRLDYTVDATMALVPAEEPVGVMRQIAAGLAWDDRLARSVLTSPPPILDRPVTIVKDVGPATEALLAQRGITTLGQLARAAPTGAAQIDGAIRRAGAIEDRAGAVVRAVVQASPTIPDVAAFLGQRLADIDTGDLAEVGISAATAIVVVADLGALLAETTATTMALSDLFKT